MSKPKRPRIRRVLKWIGGVLCLSIVSARCRRPGHCQSCGYNLKGNLSGVCPECGTGVKPALTVDD